MTVVIQYKCALHTWCISAMAKAFPLNRTREHSSCRRQRKPDQTECPFLALVEPTLGHPPTPDKDCSVQACKVLIDIDVCSKRQSWLNYKWCKLDPFIRSWGHVWKRASTTGFKYEFSCSIVLVWCGTDLKGVLIWEPARDGDQYWDQNFGLKKNWKRLLKMTTMLNKTFSTPLGANRKIYVEEYHR